MKEEIKKGNEVRLITGGPVMTVIAIEEDTAQCEWTVVDKQVSMNFKLKSLVLEASNKVQNK